MKVRFSPGSLHDLREVYRYIAADNPDAAITFVRRLKQRCIDLASFPNVGRKREEIGRGYRSVTEGDYVVIYRVLGDLVDILHVVHGNRDLSQLIFLE